MTFISVILVENVSVLPDLTLRHNVHVRHIIVYSPLYDSLQFSEQFFTFFV